MRLSCPNCGAVYEVGEGAIPPLGRGVECSACDHRWFQRPPPDEPERDAGAPEPSPAPAERPAAAAPAPVPGRDAFGPFAPPAPESPPEPPRRRATDPAVLQILREEAARELAARRREAAQADAPPPAAAPTTAPAPAAPASEASLPRRALLPEIDEAGPSPHPGTTPDGATVIHRAPDSAARGGFVAGLALSLALVLQAATAYLWADALAAAVPALAEPLGGYVAAIDALRLSIHSAVR